MLIVRFRVQLVINLHEWVYQKAEIARAAQNLRENRKTAIKIAQNRKTAEHNDQNSKFTNLKSLTLNTTTKCNYTYVCNGPVLSGHPLLAISISSSFFFLFKAIAINYAKLLLHFVGHFHRERHLDGAAPLKPKRSRNWEAKLNQNQKNRSSFSYKPKTGCLKRKKTENHNG